MSRTRTPWLRADLVKARKDFAKFGKLLEGKHKAKSKHHTTLSTLDLYFATLERMAIIPIEEFIETDSHGHPKFETGTKAPKLQAAVDRAAMSTIANSFEVTLNNAPNISKKLNKSDVKPVAKELIESLLAFSHQVRIDFAAGIQKASATVTNSEEKTTHIVIDTAPAEATRKTDSPASETHLSVDSFRSSTSASRTPSPVSTPPAQLIQERHGLERNNDMLELKLATQFRKIEEQAALLEQQKQILLQLHADQDKLENKLRKQELDLAEFEKTQAQLETFKTKYAEQQAKADDLLQRLNAIQLELTSAQQQNAIASTAHSHATDEFRLSISSLEERLHKQTSAITALREQKEALDQHIQTLQSQLHVLTAEKQENETISEKLRDELNTRLHDQEARHSAREREITEQNAVLLRRIELQDAELARQKEQLSLQVVRNTTLQEQLNGQHLVLAELKEVKAQVAQPTKRAWWKYALAAAGIIAGAIATATGVGALFGVSLLAISIGSAVAIGATTAGGGVLLAGSAAYTVIAVRGDNRAQAEYEIAIHDAQQKAGLTAKQPRSIILPPPSSPRPRPQLQVDVSAAPNDSATASSAARSFHSFQN